MTTKQLWLLGFTLWVLAGATMYYGSPNLWSFGLGMVFVVLGLIPLAIRKHKLGQL